MTQRWPGVPEIVRRLVAVHLLHLRVGDLQGVDAMLEIAGSSPDKEILGALDWLGGGCDRDAIDLTALVVRRVSRSLATLTVWQLLYPGIAPHREALAEMIDYDDAWESPNAVDLAMCVEDLDEGAVQSMMLKLLNLD